MVVDCLDEVCLGDLGGTIPRQGSALMRYCLKIQLVEHFVDGCAGAGAMKDQASYLGKT
jgi:hypothetical protein